MARLDRLATAKAVAQLGPSWGAPLRTRCSRRYRLSTRWRCSRPWPSWSRPNCSTSVGSHPSDLPVQACPHPGGRLSVAAQEHASAVPSAHCAGVGGAGFPRRLRPSPNCWRTTTRRRASTEQAIAYWQRAGQHASDRSAYLEAISHLTTGIELLKTLPETPEHTQQALTLYIGLGAALLVTKGYGAPEVEHAYTQARALCQQVGETPELVPVLLGCGGFIIARPQLHTAREIGDTLLHLARRTDDPALAVLAHYALGCPWLWLGALSVARRHLEDAIACYTPDQRRAPEFRIGHDLGVACRFYAAQILWLLGYPAQALVRLHEALTLAHALSHPLSLAWMRCRAAIFFQFCRNVPAVREQGRGRRRACDRAGLSTVGRPGERSCVGGRWPCRARARWGWSRSTRGSRPCRPPGQHCRPLLTHCAGGHLCPLGPHERQPPGAGRGPHPGRAA